MGIRAELEGAFDFDIIDEFLDHLEIMTEMMEPTIIQLQEEEGRSERINALFRTFHNIKSATSFLKLERIKLLAQLSEEVMEELRANPSHINDEIIDWLLVVSDQIRRWYDEISEDSDTLSETDPRILKIPESL